MPVAERLAGAATDSERAGSLGRSVTDHTSTRLADGRVLVVHGLRAQVFDPRTAKWRDVAAPPRRLTHHTATLLRDGSVLFTGGSGRVAQVERYVPLHNHWIGLPDAKLVRSGHTATLLRDGRVLVVGGTRTRFPSRGEVFDPTTNAWTFVGKLAHPRRDHTATRMADGTVVVIGGTRRDGGGTRVAAVEQFDPRTSTWTTRRSSRIPRAAHTATLLHDGRILIVGGRGKGRPAVKRCETYDLRTDTWAPAGSIAKGRMGHTATRLADGRVLIAGGGPECGTPQPRCEVYRPATPQQ